MNSYKHVENTEAIRPNTENLPPMKVDIKGLKLMISCSKCEKGWSIWFRDENDLLMHLPSNWYVCSNCQDNE
jgi:hypothetical protein